MPICFTARKLNEDSLAANARLVGATPMMHAPLLFGHDSDGSARVILRLARSGEQQFRDIAVRARSLHDRRRNLSLREL